MSRPRARLGYPALLAALPRHGELFALKRPPLSRLRLEAGLAAAPAEDCAAIAQLERLVRWEEAQAFQTDAAFLEEAGRRLATLPGPFLQGLAAARLELRVLLAALRRRRDGEGPPPLRGAERWPSPHLLRMFKHWSAPDFGLGAAAPWLRRAAELLGAGESFALEKLVMAQAWRQLDRAEPKARSGLERLAVYVLRWDLARRWAGFEGEAARARFERWTAAALEPAP